MLDVVAVQLKPTMAGTRNHPLLASYHPLRKNQTSTLPMVTCEQILTPVSISKQVTNGNLSSVFVDHLSVRSGVTYLIEETRDVLRNTGIYNWMWSSSPGVTGTWSGYFLEINATNVSSVNNHRWYAFPLRCLSTTAVRTCAAGTLTCLQMLSMSD